MITSPSAITERHSRSGTPASRPLLVGLAFVSLSPVLLLALRATGAAWRYPAILPSQRGVDALIAGLRGPTLVQALGTSVLLAAMTGVLGTAFGFVAGRALVRATASVRRFAAVAAFLPVVAPPIALGVGVQVLALRAGVGGGLTGVLLAHLVPAAGYLTLYFLGVLGAYDLSMEDEARTLGATPWQCFIRVTLPTLRPRLIEALLLGALVSWGQLALTLLVGGGVVRTLPVELLAFVRAGDDRLGAAAAIVLTILPALALSMLQRGAKRTGAVT